MSDTPTPGAAKASHYPSASRQKVPPFARYKGTSAWRKDRRRVRAYALFLAAAKPSAPAPGAPAPDLIG